MKVCLNCFDRFYIGYVQLWHFVPLRKYTKKTVSHLHWTNTLYALEAVKNRIKLIEINCETVSNSLFTILYFFYAKTSPDHNNIMTYFLIANILQKIYNANNGATKLPLICGRWFISSREHQKGSTSFVQYTLHAAAAHKYNERRSIVYENITGYLKNH